MRCAVVLPIYGQADLMCEAVHSLLAQEDTDGHEFLLVLMDDRCPDPRTRRKAETLARAWPGRVLSFRTTVNRGLSAMRNAGVRLALEHWPDLEAVTFVDGDDKVFGRYLSRGLSLLARHGGRPAPDGGRIGWIYEDWHQFGTPEQFLAPAPYQSIYALSSCQHTPGCFCLADMFRGGLWFDETRRGGDAEDWQFWVRCHAAGWRGHHEPSVGFRYRRRLGGLADSGRSMALKNRVLVQREFPELFHPDSYLAQETGAAARYALFDGTGGAEVGGRTMRADEAADLLVRARQLPTTAAPAYALLTIGTAREQLERMRIGDWANWYLESLIADGGVAGLALSPTSRGARPTLVPRAGTLPDARDAILALPFSLLANRVLRGESLAELFDRDDARKMDLEMPLGRVQPGSDGPSIASHEAAFRDALAAFDAPGHVWSTERHWRPVSTDRIGLDRLHTGLSALLPDREARRASLLVVDQADLVFRSGDLDVVGLARHFAERDGILPSLCILGDTLPAGDGLAAHFRSIFLAPQASRQQGAAPTPQRQGLFAAFGRIVCVDCADVIADLNGLARYGCESVAVFPRGDGTDSNLAAVMHCSYKAFRRILPRNARQAALVRALGSAREVVHDELMGEEAAGAGAE
jgi:hypothetical protein